MTTVEFAILIGIVSIHFEKDSQTIKNIFQKNGPAKSMWICTHGDVVFLAKSI